MVIKLLKKLTKFSTDLPQSSSETVESETKNIQDSIEKNQNKDIYLQKKDRKLFMRLI